MHSIPKVRFLSERESELDDPNTYFFISLQFKNKTTPINLNMDM